MVTVNARYALGKLHNPEHDTTSYAIKEAVTIVNFLLLHHETPTR